MGTDFLIVRQRKKLTVPEVAPHYRDGIIGKVEKMYTTTSISHEEIKEAAEKNDHMFFLNIIAHYSGYPLYEGNWEVCQTCNGQDWEYHSDSNILSNAIYRQGHINVALYGDRICYESFNPIAVHWTAPIPDEIKSLLDWIDSMGPDRRICLQEFKPSWENWLAYRQNITGLSLDPRVYQFL